MTTGIPNRPQPVALDASVWVSRTLITDNNHIAARAWIARHIKARGVFIIPTLFEIEVAAAVSRVTQDPQLVRKQIAYLHRLNARGLMRIVPIDPILVKDATDLATDFGLRAGDAIYAALAQQLGIALVTFDTELLRLPANIITTVRP